MRQALRIHPNVCLIPETFLPASYPLSAAVSVFLTLCASTINSVGYALRPSLKRTAPT